MSRYRLPGLALLITGLVAVVAIAARGRPLGTGGSRGNPSSAVFDYGLTSLVILGVLLMALTVWILAWKPPVKGGGRRSPLLALVLFWVGSLALGTVLASGRFQRRLRHLQQQLHITNKPARTRPIVGATKHGHAHAHLAQLRWNEIVIALALLCALGVAAYVARRRRPAGRTWQFASKSAVSAALDESLDDLRSEPDLRKAIIAAYARMERALAVAGLPRRAAEAPLEYVDRALGELAASTDAIRHLTDLFEWAKFSAHEPEPSMRDEAIAALVAVRDELRAPAAEPVAA
jgi:hypothetical protein